MKKENTAIDMINGPVTKKIILFALPIAFTSILQLLYNAADVIVIGQFAGNEPLAAVGATGSLIQLMLNLFLGLGVGVNVIASYYFGVGDRNGLSKVIHTAVLMAVFGGTAIAVFGFFLSKTFLCFMSTPSDIIDLSALYMKIYFLGVPGSLVYNFGSAFFQSLGESKKPLYILASSGIINVVLNLVFVIFFNMTVDGVALATIISQYFSAIAVVISLSKRKEEFRLSLKKLRIHKTEFMKILRYGFPAGLQSSAFSISNVIIQSAINSMGSVVVAGNTAASNIEGFIYVTMGSIQYAALTFTGQNLGANKPERIKKVALNCLLIVSAIGLIAGPLAYLFGEKLMALYLPVKTVNEVTGIIEANALNILSIKYGRIRMLYICLPYLFMGIHDVLGGLLRGMGVSIAPTTASIIGICLLRIVWIFTMFYPIAQSTQIVTDIFSENMAKALHILYASYPISWIITNIFLFGLFLFEIKKILRSKSERRL